MATEKRLIDAIELSNRLCKLDAQNRNDGLILADNEVWKMPVVDAVEVVHGRWVELPTPRTMWKCRCDRCGCPQDYKHNYCPNCGAKMDGVTNV